MVDRYATVQGCIPAPALGDPFLLIIAKAGVVAVMTK